VFSAALTLGFPQKMENRAFSGGFLAVVKTSTGSPFHRRHVGKLCVFWVGLSLDQLYYVTGDVAFIN
jgi:hypothetical protein